MKSGQLSLLDFDAGADKGAGTRDQAGISEVSQAEGELAVPCPADPGVKYFDIRRDLQYPFFCHACLVGKTADEMSRQDGAYCQNCFDFLQDEEKTRDLVKRSEVEILQFQKSKEGNPKPSGRPRKSFVTKELEILNDGKLTVREKAYKLNISTATVSRLTRTDK